MLSTTGYWIALALLSAVCATAAVAGTTKRAPLPIFGAWFGPAVLLGALGYFDWADQSSRETSLTTYLLVASLTPLGAVATAGLLRQSAPRLVQWLAASIASVLIAVVVTIAGLSP